MLSYYFAYPKCELQNQSYDNAPLWCWVFELRGNEWGIRFWILKLLDLNPRLNKQRNINIFLFPWCKLQNQSFANAPLWCSVLELRGKWMSDAVLDIETIGPEPQIKQTKQTKKHKYFSIPMMQTPKPKLC